MEKISGDVVPSGSILDERFAPGDRFLRDSPRGEEEYVIADLGFEFALISLSDGNRWTNPARVDDPYQIRLEELAGSQTDAQTFRVKEIEE